MQCPGLARACHSTDDAEAPRLSKLPQHPMPVAFVPALDEENVEAIEVEGPGHGGAAHATPPAVNGDLFLRGDRERLADEAGPFRAGEVETKEDGGFAPLLFVGGADGDAF